MGRCLRRAQAALGLVLLSISAPLVFIYGRRVVELSGVVQAKCVIAGYQADAERDTVPKVPTCETSCGFYLRAMFGTQTWQISNWMPEYVESYHSQTGFKAKHEAFSCCPTTAEDCCAFEDRDSGAFCDNFGLFRQDCPSGPWDCHFHPTPEIEESSVVPANELLVGDSTAARGPFAAGLLLGIAGTVLLLCLRPRFWFKPCIKLGHRFCRSSAFFQAALRIPRKWRSRGIQDAVEEYAARRIQAIWRKQHNSKKFVRVIRKLVENPEEARQATMTLAEKVVEWTDPKKLHGPFAARPPQPKYLYDTGSHMTFQRLVKSRVISDLESGQEQLEVVFGKGASELCSHLRVGERDLLGRELAPLVFKKPSRALTAEYGIRYGQRLVKVGKKEFPHTPGRQLIDLLRRTSSARPVVVVFEGAPEKTAPIVRSKDALGAMARPIPREPSLQQRAAAAKKATHMDSVQVTESSITTSSPYCVPEDEEISAPSSQVLPDLAREVEGSNRSQLLLPKREKGSNSPHRPRSLWDDEPLTPNSVASHPCATSFHTRFAGSPRALSVGRGMSERRRPVRPQLLKTDGMSKSPVGSPARRMSPSRFSPTRRRRGTRSRTPSNMSLREAGQGYASGGCDTDRTVPDMATTR